jgi:peptidoglycan/xylan/chitin deacetylase (PgdA/CDA1 family)
MPIEPPSQAERLARRKAAQRQRRAQRRLVAVGALLLVALVAVLAVGLFSAGGVPHPGAVAARASGASGGEHGGAAGGHATGGAAGGHAAAVASVKLGAIPAARPGTAHVIQQGPTRGGMVALTFDDGFCAACVARIVRTLQRTGAHATFFPNGTYAASWDPQAKAIRALVARGQLIVGNHTFHHVDAPAVGASAFAADLQLNEQWIERTFGLTGRPFFRPPYGAFDAGTVAAAGQAGYTKVVMWSGTLADSNLRTKPYILNAIRYWARPGAIILMHGNYPPTSEVLPQILAVLKQKHLRPVTIQELVGGSPYKAQ